MAVLIAKKTKISEMLCETWRRVAENPPSTLKGGGDSLVVFTGNAEQGTGIQPTIPEQLAGDEFASRLRHHRSQQMPSFGSKY